MSWAGYVACMGEMKIHTEFYSEKLKGVFGDLRVDGRIVLKCTLNWTWERALDSPGS